MASPVFRIQEPTDLGLALRALRDEQQVTQVDVAEAALGSRPESTNLCAYERGRRNMTVQTAIDVFRALGYQVALIPEEKITLNEKEC